MHSVPTYYMPNALANAARVSGQVVMRLMAERRIQPVAFLKYGSSKQPLFTEADITTVFSECEPARRGPVMATS